MYKFAKDFMTFFIVENESDSKYILQYLTSHPQQFGGGPFFFVLALGESITRFTWPRLSWKDFPAMLEPQHTVLDVGQFKNDQEPSVLGTRVIDCDLQHVTDDMMREVASGTNGIQLVCACDHSDKGAWAFAVAAQELFGIKGFPVVPDLKILNFSNVAIAQAFDALEQGETTKSRSSLYYGKLLQRRFEYNWWLNANALLRPVLSRVSLPDLRAPSKYEMQLLYALRNCKAMPVDDCLNLMLKWTGTGKYNPLSLGSPQSRAPMIDNLVRMGTITASNGLIFLSEAGVRFLDALPKDCEDADLPMRLAMWKSDPLSSADKADAYLCRWFSKIKRSIDQNSRETLHFDKKKRSRINAFKNSAPSATT